MDDKMIVRNLIAAIVNNNKTIQSLQSNGQLIIDNG